MLLKLAPIELINFLNELVTEYDISLNTAKKISETK